MILLACLFMVGVAQSQLVEWEANDYPNPMLESEKCGRPGGKFSKVCDPNGIISRRDADALDHIIMSLPNNTRCPCSAWSCEQTGEENGYHISVALVRKLKRKEGTPETVTATMGLASKFALTLLNKNWKQGNCNEAVIIFYSKEDGVLRTQTGSTASLVLTDEIAGAIQKAMARFFKNDNSIGQGLHYLAMNYRRVLDGQFYLPIHYTDVDSGAAVVKISILTSLITTVILKLFC